MQSNAGLAYQWTCRCALLGVSGDIGDNGYAGGSSAAVSMPTNNSCTTQAGDNGSVPFTFGFGVDAVLVVPQLYLEVSLSLRWSMCLSFCNNRWNRDSLLALIHTISHLCNRNFFFKILCA